MNAGWGETERLAASSDACSKHTVESCLTRFFLLAGWLAVGALVLCECLARAAQGYWTRWRVEASEVSDGGELRRLASSSCSYLVTSSLVVVLVVSTIVLLVFASVFEHMLA